MEKALFDGIYASNGNMQLTAGGFELPDYEEHLFIGMCAALEVLKQIHIERGEVIDAPRQFKKRQLINA